MKKIYFDYASTTPLDHRVFLEMKPYFSQKFGNPSSLHFWGQKSLGAIDFSREKIAKILGAKFNEIIFTGSATESNNLILRGIFLKAIQEFKIQSPKIIVSSIEHESILETARDLKNFGAEIVFLKANQFGQINLKELKNHLDFNTILVSIIYANNEIGTIEPLKEISKIIQEFKKENNLTNYPLLHTDASQAFQFLDCNVLNLGVDLMTLSSHKIYGPKGIGITYIKNEAQKLIKPIITGGGQEFGLRSGTENVANICGVAKAFELAEKLKSKEFKRIFNLRNYFWKKLKKIMPSILLNQEKNFKNVLPNILNVYFPNKKSDLLISQLDLAGIAVSSGSACKARAFEPSHVLLACGFSKNRASQSLRFSFGRFTTKNEIDKALKIFKIL
ncbi:MAG: cysteine desulfurase family protein [Minisyncoccia bacterium]